MKKLKKPGQVKLTCIKCGALFKTHSNNHTMCHKCKPKCRERHTFSDSSNKVLCDACKKEFIKEKDKVKVVFLALSR